MIIDGLQRIGAIGAMGRDESGVVHRAAAILRLLSETPEGFGLSELAERLGCSRSSGHRLLAHLEAVGFVRRDTATQTFRMGLSLVRLVGNFLQRLDVNEVAYPHMQRLRQETGETVTLQILIDRQAVCVAAIEGVHDLRLSGRIGFAAPFGVGANGLILQAFQPPETWGGIRESGRRRLRDIRRLGFCATCGERVPGAWAIAAPIVDSAGAVRSCISLRGPAARFSAATAAAGTVRLLGAAARISMEMAAPEPPPAVDRAAIEAAMEEIERSCPDGPPAAVPAE